MTVHQIMPSVCPLFLSCVTKEFRPHREMLTNDLNLPQVKVQVQEDFIEGGHSTLAKLDEYIKKCVAVIHLVGSGTGSTPKLTEVAALLEDHADFTRRFPFLKDCLASLSYTQWEAWLAIYHEVPCYIYRAEPSAIRATGFVEDPHERQLQEEHWQRFSEYGKDRTTFTTEQELCRLVLRSLSTILPAGEHHRNVIPKGLRSFDASDAAFFLDLLPGVHDENNLPESIRFWKHRIEEREESPFTVGVIYGPSGCGKSSLVKAGLLPRLAPHVICVYVEATADGTEARLLKGLRRRCSDLTNDLGLPQTLKALSEGTGLKTGSKLVLVIDQFEQWLHAKRMDQTTELVQALRQCDGEHVQSVLIVRDDFWTALSRFVGELNVPLLQGQNSVFVDLFDPIHSENVLAAFGRGYGRLETDLTAEQTAFIKQAVDGLSQNGRVISVRLALFAEMVKGKRWVPKTLKEIGGIEGVGFTFLEETFSTSTANPNYRRHQKAAREVLNALLPETGTDIKGHMRSYQNLLEASDYTGRPQDFDDLIRILDSETRLITPTDPEGKEGGDGFVPTVKVGEKNYQLTHDYLVPSLREWLTSKQRETSKGRAELRLAERSTLWNSKPENQQLPSLWEFLTIRFFTDRNKWNEPQKRMMQRAGRTHSVRFSLASLAMAAFITVGLWGYGRFAEQRDESHADALVQSLATAKDATDVRQRLAGLEPYQRWADPLLRRIIDDPSSTAKAKLHARLALVRDDSSQVDPIYADMLAAEVDMLPIVIDKLAPYKDQLLARLWDKITQGTVDERRHAAAALAAFDPQNKDWEQNEGQVGRDVATSLATVRADAKSWIELLAPVGSNLIAPLKSRYLETGAERDTERPVVAAALAEYLKAEPKQVVPLILLAENADVFRPLLAALRLNAQTAVAEVDKTLTQPIPKDEPTEARDARWKGQANAAVCLLELDKQDAFWPQLKITGNPTVRSFIIDRSARLGVELSTLVDHLGTESEATIRQAIVLALGKFDATNLSEAQRQQVDAQLASMYRNDADPGVHSAVAWALQQWRQEKTIQQLDAELRDTGPANGKNWFVKHGLKFVVVQAGTIQAPGETGKVRSVSVGYRFAIAAHEVTVEQFQKLLPDISPFKDYARTPDCPMNSVSWYDAVHYCNLLSKAEGLQPCYEPNPNSQENYGYTEGMTIPKDFLKRTGYRLPTEMEWEYACRANTTSSYCLGEPIELLDRYAWYFEDSHNQSHRVGQLLPNGLGCFDMHGNVWEWCHDLYKPKDDDHIVGDDYRVLRGGAFINQPGYVRSAYRLSLVPTSRSLNSGFRPSRTYP